jgi:hypothetical protein
MVEQDASHFAIVVNDEAAVYPVLIDPTLVNQWVLNGAQNQEEFGYVVADPGKILGGLDEDTGLMIGAPRYDNGSATYAGAVFVFYGNTTPTTAWSFIGTQSGAYLGTSASTAGDLYGSGCDGIVVGAPGYSSGGFTANGMVYVFAGGPNGLTGPVLTVAGWGNNMGYGQSACGVHRGMLVLASYGGFAFGAPSYLEEGYSGQVEVFSGSANGPVVAGWVYGSANPT